MKYTTALLALVLVYLPATHAQNPRKPETPQAGDRLIITTSLVQVDAVVTDRKGNQITDLQGDDFEIVEGGEVRPVVGFSYVALNSKSPKSAETINPAPSPKGTTPPQLHALRPENVRRAIAIVVDDFGLSFESIARLRSGLIRFISEQTEPNDVIAIVRSSGGPGAMQQFTSNKTALLATIRRLRWYPTGRGGIAAHDSMNPFNNNENGVYLPGYSSNVPRDLSSREFFGGSLGTLGFVIERLAPFPGRKSMVVISENLPLTSYAALTSGATNVLDKFIALANQHSIVISTMDARGLPKSGMTADDSQYNLAANQVDKHLRERGIKFNVAQDTLNYLAEKTGGVFVRNNNDLNNGLRRIIDSEQGYYLLAFRPDDADKERPDRAYKVTLRLKRPDLVLRSRSGFHRFTRPLDQPPNETKFDVLRDALASPFVKEDVRLKVTALFTGSLDIKVLLHVEARDLTFTKTPEGNYKGSFDMAVVAFDDNGKVAQQLLRSQPLMVPADAYEKLQREGLVYTINLPMKKAGSYQVRLAVRDDESGLLGCDSQAVDVPETKPSRLSVSGLIVQGMNTPMRGGPAVRRFASGDTFEYSYLVYGARQNANNKTELMSQLRLFRGSEEVFTGGLLPTTIAAQVGGERIIAGGTFRLGTALPPGDYFLQVIVTDKLAPAEMQSSSQWIDFQIVK
jgi:VWFA-related protein